MDAFRPSTASFTGRLSVQADPVDAFPLFSPQGERSWVPGWNPEILSSRGGEWRQGQIFRTRDEHGEAIWVVSRLDLKIHEVEYHRVQSGRYVAQVVVRCRPSGRQRSEVTVSYSFVGLSATGNREIEAMTQGAHDEKLECWARWIAGHLDGAAIEPSG